MKQIYEKLQMYFAEGNNKDAEDYLIECMKEAQKDQNYNMLIMLLNEMIGLCRESGQKEKSLGYSSQVLQLMQQLGMQDSEAYATTLINVATACRAAGKHVEAYQFYMEVFPLYEKWLAPGDVRYASLYNNMSLLFQETEEYERAAECQSKALSVLTQYPDRKLEMAVSHANLASTLCKISEAEGAPEIAGQAVEEAQCAIRIFEEIGVEDVHKAAALSAYADGMMLLGNYVEAQSYYERALEMVERLVGRTYAYERVAEKLECAVQRQGVSKTHVSGLALAREYYENVAKPVLMEKFPEYFDRMAIGLYGEGSECLGFDDALSSDHDFGPGFVIWLSEEDEAKIGEEVQRVYEALPKEFQGYERKETAQGSGRTGVTTYNKYYERILGIPNPPSTMEEWLYVDEYALRTAASGEMFHDPKGEFTSLQQKLLQHYPKEVQEKYLWQEYTLFEQCGPYNYPRMLRRGDVAGANLLLAEAMQHAAKFLYVRCKVFAPHTKWLIRGLEELKGCEKETWLIKKILQNPGSDPERNNEIMHWLSQLSAALGEKMKPELVDEIVKLEWNAFDKVKNEGGRAGCQDDFTTFEIMRKSQYLTWNTEMLMQYRDDFSLAVEKGWNPIMEKYARMMESTAPEKYEELAPSLPKLTDDKKAIMEEIISIQVAWMEAFAEKYPKVAGNARSIHTSEDTAYNTSYETYLRGEMGTYSDKMLLLYGAFIAGLAKEGKNLAYLTMENTVHMYGYADVDTAEEKMW